MPKMASGLLRPVRRRQLPVELLRPGFLGDSLLGLSHDLQSASAGGTAVPGQHRSESSDTGVPPGRGRGRGQPLTGEVQDRKRQPGTLSHTWSGRSEIRPVVTA